MRHHGCHTRNRGNTPCACDTWLDYTYMRRFEYTDVLQVRYVCGEGRSDVVASIKVCTFHWQTKPSAVMLPISVVRSPTYSMRRSLPHVTM